MEKEGERRTWNIENGAEGGLKLQLKQCVQTLVVLTVSKIYYSCPGTS